MKTSIADPRCPILLVEDSDDDLILLRRLLRAAGIPNPLVVLHSGASAIAYLEKALSGSVDFCMPAIVLTDLKMLDVSGVELARWIKRKRELAETRIVMLTASNHPLDRSAAQQVGVEAFFVKFPSPDELKAAILLGGQPGAPELVAET